MPESRLQSNMLQNMSRAQRRAMAQRGQIASNQREWMDYIQIRDSGGYGGGNQYYGDSSGEHLADGRAYREQMSDQRRSQIQYQRFQQQRFLEAQEFQNAIALENYKAQQAQQETEQEQKQILGEIEQWKNNAEVDPYTREWNMNQLYGKLWDIDAAPNQPKTYDIDTGVTDREGNPIFDRWQLTPEGTSVKIVDGVDNYNKRVSEDRQRDEFDEKKTHNGWLRQDGTRKTDQKDRELDQSDRKTVQQRAADLGKRRGELRGEQIDKANHNENTIFAGLLSEHKQNWIDNQYQAAHGNANHPAADEARIRAQLETKYTPPSSGSGEYLQMKNQAHEDAYYGEEDPYTVPRGDIDERQGGFDNLEVEPEDLDPEFNDQRVDYQPEQDMIAQTDVMEDMSGNPLDMDQGMFELPA